MIRKYFLLGMMALLSVSTLAQYEQTGGFARLQGMGNNPYIIDPYFMTVNPAWGAHYQNFLFGDLGSSNGAFQSGGVGQFIAANFHVGGGLSLGGMLTRNDFGGFSIGRLDPGFIDYNNGAPTVLQLSNRVPGVISLNNNVELFGSYKRGNTAFGLGLAYASTNNETNLPTGGSTISSASQFGVNAGIITQFTGSMMLDLGVSLMFPSATLEPITGSNTEYSQTFIFTNARLFWKYSSKLSFVPSIVFVTSSGTAEIGQTEPSTSTDLTSLTFISVGLGSNYQVGDFLLAGGVGFATTSLTFQETPPNQPELSWSVFIFPVWNLGVEWNLTEWFVGRFGYVASTQSITQENGTTNNITETITTTFLGLQGATLGVGFRLGNFSLDATVNEDVLRQGLNNLGGNGAGAATFAYLSLSYAMP